MENDKIIEQIKSDYKTAEEWILLYYDRRAEYYDESRYINDRSYNMDVGRAGDTKNNWRDFQVIQFSNLDYTEKWLLAIECMYQELPTEKRIFIEQRRRAEKKNQYLREQKKGRTNWVTFVQEHYTRAMADEYNGQPEDFWISEKTIKLWWREIIELTRLIAIKKGCIF